MPGILDFLFRFSSVLWEAMPFVVLGAVVAGVLEEFLPQEALTRFLPKAVLPSVMIGAVLGLLFPMCECGIVVVMRRLLRKGLPLSCCIAYMLAGPVINGVVMFRTWVAFKDHKIGPEMVGMRVGLAFIVACVTGLIVHLQFRRYGNALLTATAIPPAQPKDDPASADTPPAPAPREPLMRRRGNISATALHDFVDIKVFLIIVATAGAVSLVELHTESGEVDGSILYLDEQSTPGRLLVTTMDPVYHHGSGFMPGATQLLYSSLHWATRG